MIRAIAVLAATAVVLAGPAPAMAAPPTGLDAAKRATTLRIDGRLAFLRAEGVAVRNAARLSDAHQSTLEDILDHATDGLTELRAKVRDETTVEAVKADAERMVNDYRVYLLIGPQVRLTIVADVGSAAVGTLEDAYTTLSTAIDTAEQGGADVTAAREKLAEMRTHIDAAKSGIDGAAGELLAVKPGPDGAAIRAQVRGTKEELKAARAELREAAQAAKAVRDLLA